MLILTAVQRLEFHSSGSVFREAAHQSPIVATRADRTDTPVLLSGTCLQPFRASVLYAVMPRLMQLLPRLILLFACLLAVAAVSAEQTIEVEIVGIEGPELDNVRAFLSIAQLRPKKDLLTQLTTLQQTGESRPVTERMLRRLHKKAPQEIREALQSYGYYQPKIESTLEQTEQGWLARYQVEPGPPVLLQQVDIELQGEGRDEPGLQSVLAAAGLSAGQRLLHSRYAELKTDLMKAAFNMGYLEARFSRSEIRVDKEKQVADILLTLDTGPRYYFGVISVQQDILDQAFVDRFVKIKQDEPFRTDRLLALQAALSDSGYFARVEVQAKREQAVDHRIPVTIEAEPRKRRSYALGAGYATDTGPRVTAGVVFRRINRRGHQVLLDSRVSQVKQEVSAQYQIPIADVLKDRLVFRGAASREDIDKGEADKYTLGISHNQGWLGAQRRLYTNLSREDYSLSDDDDTVIFLTPGINLSRLKSDDLLFPREGYSWALDVRGASEKVISDMSYLRGEANGNMVFALGKQGRLLLRGQIGGIGTEDIEGVPATERFYAGGDQSVRGYGYQSLGPTKDDQNVGGRYLLVGSVEVDYLFAGNFGAAAFFDAGNADDDLLPDLKRGAGIGFRWRSPVGMARLDLAKALDDDEEYRIHISIGSRL